MEDKLEEGDYKTVLEFVAAFSLGWLAVGDSVFNTLLSKREQEELVSTEAQCDLEELAVNYMRELHNDN